MISKRDREWAVVVSVDNRIRSAQDWRKIAIKVAQRLLAVYDEIDNLERAQMKEVRS